MLIKLSSDLIKLTPTPDQLDALENLCCAAWEERHLLWAEPATLEALKTWKPLSNRSQILLKKLYRDAASEGDLPAVSGFIMVVPKQGIHYHPPEFRVGLDWFIKSANAGGTRLFCESIDDFRFYSLIGRSEAKDRKFPCYFEPFPVGGGNYTHSWDLAAAGSPALGIVDSERKSKGRKIGSTAKGAQETDKALDTSIRTLHTLEVHEIENLLPDWLLKKLAPSATLPNNLGYADLKIALNLEIAMATDWLNQNPSDVPLLLGSLSPPLRHILFSWGLAAPPMLT